MNNAFMKVLFSEMIRVITFPLRLMPIKNNRILFTGLTGGDNYDYSCNPKYIYEYMRTYHENEYEYIWMVSDCSKYDFLKEEGVKLYKHFTVSSFPMLLTSKVIVTNGSYAPWFPFRKNQYVINTWHGGGAYKKVENERPDANFATKWRAKLTADNIDLFVASCRTQEEKMIRKTYNYKGEVLREGTPRNDMLVKGNISGMAEKVRRFYNIPDDNRILLYAPTYRNLNSKVTLDSDVLLERLESNGEKWVLISRYHRYQKSESNVRVTGSRIIYAMDYPDMQELLCAADVLITDYSSCVWDYSFLKRPCILYVPDKEEYNSKTGFYVDMDNWPFPESYTIDGLADNIKELLEDNRKRNDYIEGIDAHLDELGSYESGKASEIVCGKIEAVTKSHISFVRSLVKGIVFRVIYPLIYRISALRPVDVKKAVFIENHEDYLTDNYVSIYNELQKTGFDNRVHHLMVSSSGWGSIIKRSIKVLWDIGNAAFIFLDESNSLMGSFRLKKKTKMIQLWHACGAFKKWGFSVADKAFGDDIKELKRYSGHRNYSLVPVSGEAVCWAYREAFGVDDPGIIKPLGVSRTDILFDKDRRVEARKKLEDISPNAEKRKIVVYLPTFRGSIAKAKGPDKFDPEKLKRFRKEMVFLIKNHPFVKEPFDIREEYRDFCKEISEDISIDELILGSDVCITDYSSVVFEYSLMNRPILFFAYDIDEYDMERGFYYPYQEFVPGPIVYSMEQLSEAMESIEDFDYNRLDEFRKKYMSGCDGHATEKILSELNIV